MTAVRSFAALTRAVVRGAHSSGRSRSSLVRSFAQLTRRGKASEMRDEAEGRPDERSDRTSAATARARPGRATGPAWRARTTSLLLWALIGVLPAADNLVVNGDFSQADAQDAARPLGWDKPDGLGVQWVDSADAAHGKVIRMDTTVSEQAMIDQWKKVGISEWKFPQPGPEAIGEKRGLSLYSRAFPVTKGKAYRLVADYRGGGVKVWVRGYMLSKDGKERLRIYEGQAEGLQHAEGWNTIDQVFRPTTNSPAVKELRLLLSSRGQPGVAEFDDVLVEEIDDAKPTR